ncbi:MAG: site-specific integrase [Sandaracinaceae bacterium]|nr:site-specific integrase [Sandaracinaceae bacterium]
MTNHQERRVEPGICQLNKNTFRLRVRITDSTTGKRYAKCQEFEGSLRSARSEREALRVQLQQGMAEDRTKVERLTVGTCAHSWLSTSLARGDLARSTAQKYATALDLHIVPGLGDLYLDALRPKDIEQWMLREVKRHKPNTVNSWRTQLICILSYAERDGLIARNIAKDVKPLKLRADADEDNALSVAELRQYLIAWEQTYPDRYPLILTLALTGMRWGEATALRWDDVSAAEAGGALTVRRSHVRGELKETKTNRTRRVPFPAHLARVLREHRLQLVATQAPGLSAGWVFPSSNGKVRSNGSESGRHRAVLRKIGVTRKVTIHGLRHTATDLLRLAPVDPVVAASIIGHQTDRMREHYSMVGAVEARASGDAIAGLIGLAVPVAP